MSGLRLVVKVGGAVAGESTDRILGLREEGHEVVVVHGAGPQITHEMERRGIPVEFVNGRRRTSRRALDVVRESLVNVNAGLCDALGDLAVPVIGDTAGLLAVPVPPLGWVGDPLPCRPAAILNALAAGKIPVVAPLAVGPLNVNADDASAALALGLGARRLVFLTDVAGLFVNDDLVDSIRVGDANAMLDAGAFDGGIVPKLRAAAIAAASGITARDRLDGGRPVTSTTSLAKLLPTYARLPVTFVDGDGSWLVDDTGKRYLDLFAGIAVVGLGHRHPAPLAAAHAQLDRLWHVSNLYSTEPMQELSLKLSDRFGGASAFFCNSGAEANEAALKWARKATGRTEFVALDGSFHGRTFGALSITGQPAKRAAFEPLVPGAKFGLEHVGPNTAAIILEPVQGEGGVHPLTPAVPRRGAQASPTSTARC